MITPKNILQQEHDKTIGGINSTGPTSEVAQSDVRKTKALKKKQPSESAMRHLRGQNEISPWGV